MKRTGREVSSRSAVIVLYTGEPRPEGTLTCETERKLSEEGLYLRKELLEGKMLQDTQKSVRYTETN